MANAKLRCIFFLLAVSYVMSDRFVGGRKELVKHKGTVKTIQAKNGDVIDCVDIYQQPAFDHPLLKNHIIQMKPSSIPNITNGEFFVDAKLFRGLHEDEECPEGTIPIIRHAREDENSVHGAIHAIERQKKLNISVDYATNIAHEYAGVGLSGGKYYGARAFLNVWSPATLGDGDLSIAQVGVKGGPSDSLNSIEAGWMVNSRDKQPRIFLYWTRDGSKTTGCYNVDCPGFVHVSSKIGLGSALHPLSTVGGTQFSLPVAIYQNKGNWWLQVNEEMLGYMPSSIFPDLATSATAVSWGGQVYDAGKMGHHTSTQMGNGHFASEGFGKASYFTHVEYKHETGYFLAAEGLEQYVTKPACYSLNLIPKKGPDFGIYFYYGGPGFSATCP